MDEQARVCGFDVAVVLPVRNGGSLFAEQLQALADQDFEGRFEVVVADNGSTDETRAIAERFGHELSIRIVDADERPGPAYARNVGARAARAEWVAFCDADDVADRSWLRALYGARDRGDVIGGHLDARRLNPDDILQARGFQESAPHLPAGPLSFLPYVPSGNLLIRREVLERLGGWDEEMAYCEDVDLSWRAQLSGLTLAYEPAAVMHYRFRDSARAMYRQVRNYASCDATLYRRYGHRGAQRPDAGLTPAQVFWLASRSPYLLLGRRRRLLWVAVAAEAIGRRHGHRAAAQLPS